MNSGVKRIVVNLTGGALLTAAIAANAHTTADWIGLIMAVLNVIANFFAGKD